MKRETAKEKRIRLMGGKGEFNALRERLWTDIWESQCVLYMCDEVSQRMYEGKTLGQLEQDQHDQVASVIRRLIIDAIRG